jgi:hypothetical protein
MMEAAGTSETLVNFYQTTQCYNPEDSHLHTHRRENLKSNPEDSHLHTRRRKNLKSHGKTFVYATNCIKERIWKPVSQTGCTSSKLVLYCS